MSPLLGGNTWVNGYKGSRPGCHAVSQGRLYNTLSHLLPPPGIPEDPKKFGLATD